MLAASSTTGRISAASPSSSASFFLNSPPPLSASSNLSRPTPPKLGSPTGFLPSHAKISEKDNIKRLPKNDHRNAHLQTQAWPPRRIPRNLPHQIRTRSHKNRHENPGPLPLHRRSRHFF